MTVRYLTLVLTTACNLNCAYCYRDETTGSQTMSRETAEKSLRLAAASGQSFHVQLTGGEPTLEPELIEWVADIIHKAGWPATIGLQTNGTQLDRALIRLCDRYHVQIGVSVDGPPHIHNLLRGRAEATVRGLKLLTEMGCPFRVTTVITNHNISELGKLVLLLSVFPNMKGLGLDLLVQKGRARRNQIIPPSPLALREGITEMVKRLDQVNARRKSPILLREWEILQKAFTHRKHGKPPLFCHACNGESLAVHPDGTCYPCGQTVGDPFFHHETHEIHGNVFAAAFPTNTAACSECPLADFCPGDCPSRQYYNDESVRGLTCILYRMLWENYTIIR